jgi:hypothetical protein
MSSLFFTRIIDQKLLFFFLRFEDKTKTHCIYKVCNYNNVNFIIKFIIYQLLNEFSYPRTLTQTI